MSVHSIVVCDDDDNLRDALVEQLNCYGDLMAVGDRHAADVISRVNNNIVHLVVMDIGLPDITGQEAVLLLRKNNYCGPIIMLTANSSDADVIQSLAIGANDYVVKPFKFAVLVARIKAHLRQYASSEDAVFTIGQYSFRPSVKTLVADNGLKIKLTEKEVAILKFLYRFSGEVVRRETLLTEVWGYNAHVTTHTLETHIYRLRKKIEIGGANSSKIITEPGGYRLSL